MSVNVGNIKIEPCDAIWQIEEQWLVGCAADVASSLNNDYFFIYSGANAKFHVWFNVGGAGVDPAPSGSTGITVAIAANASASAVASAVQAAVDGNANFVASVQESTKVLITADAVGETDDYGGGTVVGFTFTQCQEGGNINFGYLEGDIEVALEESTNEVTAHQTGPELLAELRQGKSAEITMTLKECDAENLKNVFSASGGAYTPSGGTELFGWGSLKQGQSTVVAAKRLILHPVVLGDTEYTRDLCFWKAYPLPDTLTFSGENPQTLSVTFKCYRDDSKPEEINFFSYGDWTQLVPVVP